MQEHDNVQSGATVDQRILAVLEENPGLKAREIATHLDVDKKLVNSALYGSIKNKCIQDKKYYWYLNKDMPTSDKSKKVPISKTALSNLCHYYLACLGQDDEGGISVLPTVNMT